MRQKSSEGFAVKFDMKARSYNKQSRTGGKMYHYNKAKLVMEEGKMTDVEKEVNSLKFKKSPKKNIEKNPQHYSNKTRNIRLEDGSIKKININYIIEFNGKKVIY